MLVRLLLAGKSLTALSTREHDLKNAQSRKQLQIISLRILKLFLMKLADDIKLGTEITNWWWYKEALACPGYPLSVGRKKGQGSQHKKCDVMPWKQSVEKNRKTVYANWPIWTGKQSAIWKGFSSTQQLKKRTPEFKCRKETKPSTHFKKSVNMASARSRKTQVYIHSHETEWGTGIHRHRLVMMENCDRSAN